MAREAKSAADMPAGDAKREQMRVNQDHLAEEAEVRSADRGTIDPQAFEPDRDILQVIVRGGLEVSDAQPEFVYCWVCSRLNGAMIDAKLTFRVPDPDGRMIPCWELVKGDKYPEAKELVDVTGLRRIGDVVLMRCRRDRYALIQRYEKAQRDRRRQSVDSVFLDMGEKARQQGLGVITRVDKTLADPRLRAYARRAAAQGIAREKFDDMVREGSIPGLPANEDEMLARQAAAEARARYESRNPAAGR